MTSIKQKIPSYVAGGMSDQPDELKAPGQLREMTNAFPDVTLNLMKRPGFQWSANLSNAQPEGRWFNITAESPYGIEEQYIVNIHKNSGSVFIWAADDIKDRNGNVLYNKGYQWVPGFKTDPIPLITDSSFTNLGPAEPSNAFEYFQHTNEDDLQVLNIGATTLVTNRRVSPTMTTSSPGGSERPHEAFVDLQQVAYNRQYSLNITGPGGYTQSYTTATRITVTGSDLNPSDGSCWAVGSQLFENISHDIGAGGGKNLRVRITTNGTSIPNPDGRDDYNCQYRIESDLLYGGEGWSKGDTVRVFMDSVTPPDGQDTPNYLIRIQDDELIVVEDAIALIRPDPTPSDASVVLKAETILADLKKELDDTGFFEEVTIIGNGIYLRADTPFSVSTPEKQLFNILSSTEDKSTRKIIDQGGGITTIIYGTSLTNINNVSLLPLECRHNYLVKVTNSLTEDDDYYLQFKGGNNSDGEGVWEETWRPGIKTTINPNTMPQQIRRVWDTNNRSIEFIVAGIEWTPRTCGDDNTNPVPSFIYDVDNNLFAPTINNMLLYRNRLVMLTGSKVVLSQAGQLGNFFKETALISSPVDPIDIECSVDTSSMLYDGLVINNGMVLFSRFHQFMFTTDSDVLKADTAKCTLLASYDFNTQSNPFNMASNIGFFSTTNSDSIFWEMRDIFREGPPTVTERSKPLSKTLPGNLNLLCASREDGLILASKKGISDIWAYRYYSEGNRDIQRAWFKWTIPGEMIYHFNNTRGKYWIVYKDGGSSRLLTFNTDGFEQFKYLDNWTITQANGYSDGKTSFSLPFSPQQDIMAYAFESGRVSKLTYSGNTAYADGNWQDEGDVLVGYPFEMRLEFPHLYVFKQENNTFRSDTDSSLTIHRLKFNFNAVGYYQLYINRYGKDDYVMDIELPQADNYNLNTPALKREEQFTVPVYERNTSFDYILTSSNPTPNVLLSMTYEGDYTDKYYKRV